MNQTLSDLRSKEHKSPLLSANQTLPFADSSGIDDSVADLPKQFSNTNGHHDSPDTPVRRRGASLGSFSGHQRPQLQYTRTNSLAYGPSHPQPPDSVDGIEPMVEIPLEPAPGKLRAFYNKNRGLAYVLAAQFFGTLMNVTTRVLEVEGNHGEGMHPLQILFIRMLITTVLSTFYMWYTKIPHFPFGLPEVRWLLALRGVGGFFGVFGMYYSLLYLPLADATVITFITPSLSCWACSVLLKEPFTRTEQLGGLISFFGVILIARPQTFFHTSDPTSSASDVTAAAPTSGASDYQNVTSSQRLSAISVALLGVLGSAMAFTAMRWIAKRAHPLLSVNYFSAWCTLVSAVSMAVLPSVDFLLPANLKEWSYLIFLGICGFAMQFLLSAGLQAEKSSRATNMVYTQMLFALLFDKVVFGTNPTLLSVLGSTLILGSAIYVAVQRANWKQRQEEEKARQEAANDNGVVIEMERRGGNGVLRDEERGLVRGMDEDDDDDRLEEELGRDGTKPIARQHTM